MCVIAVSETGAAGVPMSILRAMWETNPDGAGIAWASKGRVHVIKGLMSFAEFAAAARRLPKKRPFILHFRISTVGGVVPHLTHPFIVSEKSPEFTRGKFDVPVLFHNGHWSGWQDELKLSTFANGGRFPDGRISDSRAMAVLAARHGLSLGQTIESQRIVILTPKGEVIRTGQGWTRHDHLAGLWTSNCYWQQNLKENAVPPLRKLYDLPPRRKAVRLSSSSPSAADICASFRTSATMPIFTDAELRELQTAVDPEEPTTDDDLYETDAEEGTYLDPQMAEIQVALTAKKRQK